VAPRRVRAHVHLEVRRVARSRRVQPGQRAIEPDRQAVDRVVRNASLLLRVLHAVDRTAVHLRADPAARVISANDPYTTSRGELYIANGALGESVGRVVSSSFMKAPSLGAPGVEAGNARVRSMCMSAPRARQRRMHAVLVTLAATSSLRHHHPVHQAAVLV
jgi:hypothetical protein